jgi:cell division protein FtsL
MDKLTKQAHKQAPWRVQLQSLGLFLLILAVVAVVAGLYLSISAQAAAAGLEIRSLESQRDDSKQQIDDLQTFLAWMNSSMKMNERAQQLGFERITAEQAIYVAVPGYSGREPSSIPIQSPGDRLSTPIIKPSYTQSLWDWLYQGINEFK